MASSQALMKQRPSDVEPFDSVEGPGKPEVAERKAKGDTPWENIHPVNLRLSIPLLSKRYFLTIVAGQERRNSKRRREERRRHPIKTTGNIAFLLAAGTVVGITLLTLVQLVGYWVLMQTGWVQP